MILTRFLIVVFLTGCATVSPTAPPAPPALPATTRNAHDIVVHLNCVEEMRTASSTASRAGHPFASVTLSEECRRDWLYALNQSLGGGSVKDETKN